MYVALCLPHAWGPVKMGHYIFLEFWNILVLDFFLTFQME